MNKYDLLEVLKKTSYQDSKTITGQHNREPNSDPSLWTRYVQSVTGKTPGLWGGDFLYQQDDVNHRQDMTNEAIKQWQAGSLVALTFHTCKPSLGDYCSWDDVKCGTLSEDEWNRLLTDGQDLNQNWKARMDHIVPFLKQMIDAGVVPIFRIHHEMNKGWSWWGGSKEHSPALFRLSRDYINDATAAGDKIVWNWNVQDEAGTNFWDWYPGDDYVDILSLDIWEASAPTNDEYQNMLKLANGRPIALAEVGTLPTTNLLSQQPHWAWFMVWAEYIQNQNSQDAVKQVYYSGNVCNRGDFSLGPLPPAPTNLALGKVIKAGSSDDASRGPEKAVDGDMGTRWSSAYSDQQWIYVDLGQEYSIGSVRLYWETAYAKAFQIQVSSDEQTWSTVYENDNGSGGTSVISLSSKPAARFVKMYAYQRGTQYGYSLFEFQVFSA
jgi:mannan endo-1,4-beta-mannosidase